MTVSANPGAPSGKAVQRRGRGRPQGRAAGFEERRQRIVEIATKVFAELGYTGASVNDLTRATGLGKGALYNYIESKENLLVEIASMVMAPLLSELRDIDELDEPAMVRLRMVSEAILDGIAVRPHHVWVYEHDYRFLTGENRTRFLQQRDEMEQLVERLMEEAASDGTFRGGDIRLLSFQFFSLHKQTVQWFDPSGVWTPAELSREYCRTLFNGFAVNAATFDAVEWRAAKRRVERRSAREGRGAPTDAIDGSAATGRGLRSVVPSPAGSS